MQTLAILLALLFAQRSPNEMIIWTGVYTEDQAVRGEAQYEMHCAKCHRDNLDDSTSPKLIGDFFMDRWREDNLDSLYKHMRTRMPADTPATLSNTDYVDIIAYLLEANDFPAGKEELKPSALGNIRIVGKNGPQPLPTNTLVQVVGCMASGTNASSWLLNKATEPARTRNADEITPEELQTSASKVLGQEIFRLQNLDELRSGFDPHVYSGHKVQVKGVLLKDTNGQRLNVISIESVASMCS